MVNVFTMELMDILRKIAENGYHGQKRKATEANIISSNDLKQLFSVTTSPNSNRSKCWHLDSGVTQHMTPERSLFTSQKVLPKARIVNFGHDSDHEMMGIGNISLKILDGAHKQIQDV